MAKFEKMIESNPKAALRQIEKFVQAQFWDYWQDHMKTTREILMLKLVHCDYEDIPAIREKIKALTETMAFPSNQIEILKDLIELEKDAEKVREAVEE